MLESVEGRVVWVTGAGSGIGRAVAAAFAAGGAKVALTGRRTDALAETERMIAQAGGTAVAAPADVSDQAAVADAHGAVVAAFGPVDILVNNAGLNAKRRHWKDLSAADAAAVVDANLKGPLFCTLAVLPAMRERRRGLIIHVASFAATGTFLVSGPTYTASKTGHRALSATINAEEGIHGIRSVCINPGEVATDILLSRPAPPSPAERAIMVQPEDIAEAALFAARLPARACVSDMTVTPTDNNAFRADARAIEALP